MSSHKDDVPFLSARGGPLDGQRWSIESDLTIGREPGCEVVIPSRQVSRAHARLSQRAEGIWLEDLGSKNGTHCNGEQVSEPVLLHDGDVIQVALAQQFFFFSSDATLPLDSNGLEHALANLPAAGQSPVLQKPAAEAERLRLDRPARRVWVLGQEVNPPLSAAQFDLLALMYDHAGEVVSRSKLIEVVWGNAEFTGVSEQALDALIRRLRERLNAYDPAHPYLVTVRGHGLRLDNPGRA